MCGSAPDPTARRSALACELTFVFGTVGLFGGTFVVLIWRAAGLAEFMIEWAIGLGAFAVYFSALVFLMRFHAAVAGAFGNRWLERECYVYLFAPLVAMAVNFVFLWVERFRFARPPFFRVPDDPGASSARTVFNFAVVLWYAMIVLRTFRTIDRGPTVAEARRCQCDPTTSSCGRKAIETDD